jgi:hypothetical protein
MQMSQSESAQNLFLVVFTMSSPTSSLLPSCSSSGATASAFFFLQHSVRQVLMADSR